MRTFTYGLYKGEQRAGLARLVISVSDVVPENFLLEQENLLPEVIRKAKANGHKIEDSLYLWLKTRIPDIGLSGAELDKKIINILGLSPRMLSRGRLDGLQNLISLLKHCRDKSDTYRMLPESPAVISFLHIAEWDRILMDTKESELWY